MFYKLSTIGVKKKSHKHIALLPNGVEQGTTSIDANHQHGAVFAPEVGWTILEIEGHTHEILEVIGDKPFLDEGTEEDDRDKVEEGYALFNSALDNEGESIDEGKKNFDFYLGKHWSEQAKHQLESEGRPCITINIIASMCDRLHGYFLQSIPDLTVYPITKDDDIVADIIQKVVKNILMNSDQKQLFSATFLDQLVAGKSNIAIEVTKDSSLMSNIRLVRNPFDMIVYGHHLETDLRDCGYMVRYYYLSKNDIKLLWPEKWEELKPELESPEIGVIKGEEWNRDNYAIGKPLSTSMLSRGVKMYDEYTKQYLLVEIERKINYTKHYVTIGENILPMNLNSYEISAIKSMGLSVEKVMDYTIRKDVMCGKVLLSSEDTELKTFSTIPFYSKFINGKWNSSVTDMRDLNQEANKRSSHLTEIINRCASYNYFYDNDTFGGNIAEESAFKRNASKPGAVFKVSTLGNRPQLQEGIKFPVEVLQTEQIMYERLSMIFGQMVSVEPNQNLSSRAMLQNTRYNMLVQEHLFHNFNTALRMLGKTLVQYIQMYYTPAQILRIIRDTPTSPDEKSSFDTLEDNAILKLLISTDLTKYDVSVDTSKYSPTFRESVYESLAPLVQAGVLPASSLVDYSSVPDKQKILDTISQSEQAKQVEAETNKSSEIEKTLAAAGYDKNMIPLKFVSYQKMLEMGVPQEQIPQFLAETK